MTEKLSFSLIARDKLRSGYDWLNIDRGVVRIGKVRGLIKGKTLIIFSINIFPAFEGHGYARTTIKMFKESFNTIIADRVRYTAVGFWEKMGFVDAGKGKYVYDKCGSRFKVQGFRG